MDETDGLDLNSRSQVATPKKVRTPKKMNGVLAGRIGKTSANTTPSKRGKGVKQEAQSSGSSMMGDGMGGQLGAGNDLEDWGMGGTVNEEVFERFMVGTAIDGRRDSYGMEV